MIYADSRRPRLIAALCVWSLPGDAASGLLHATTSRPTPLAEPIASIPWLEHDHLLPYHALEVILLLLYPSLHLVDSFPQLADVILDLPLEKLIDLRNELLLIGRDCILLFFHLLVVQYWTLFVILSLKRHDRDLQLFLGRLLSYHAKRVPRLTCLLSFLTREYH
jgi:hypothetical protein